MSLKSKAKRTSRWRETFSVSAAEFETTTSANVMLSINHDLEIKRLWQMTLRIKRVGERSGKSGLIWVMHYMPVARRRCLCLRRIDKRLTRAAHIVNFFNLRFASLDSLRPVKTRQFKMQNVLQTNDWNSKIDSLFLSRTSISAATECNVLVSERRNMQKWEKMSQPMTRIPVSLIEFCCRQWWGSRDQLLAALDGSSSTFPSPSVAALVLGSN